MSIELWSKHRRFTHLNLKEVYLQKGLLFYDKNYFGLSELTNTTLHLSLYLWRIY